VIQICLDSEKFRFYYRKNSLVCVGGKKLSPWRNLHHVVQYWRIGISVPKLMARKSLGGHFIQFQNENAFLYFAYEEHPDWSRTNILEILKL